MPPGMQPFARQQRVFLGAADNQPRYDVYDSQLYTAGNGNDVLTRDVLWIPNPHKT